MKKSIAIFLAAMLVLPLVACNRAMEEPVPTTDPFIAPLPTQAPTMPSIEPNIPDPTVNSNSTENETEITSDPTLPQARRLPKHRSSVIAK